MAKEEAVSRWLLLLLLTGCLKPPEYDYCVPTNETWRTEADFEELPELDWSTWADDHALESLIEYALEENQDIHIALARVQQFYDQYVIVRSQLFPEVNATTAPFKYENTLATIPAYPKTLPRIIDDFPLSLNIFYEADLFGKISNRSKEALNQWIAQDYSYRDVQLTIVANVSTHYVILRQYDAQLEVSKRTAVSREEYMKIAQLRFDEGLTSELPVIQARTEWESAMIAVKRLDKLIAIEENLISLLIGAPPTEIPRGQPLTHLGFPRQIPVGLPSDLLYRRPDILAAERRLAAAGYSVAAARADFFPKITLTGMFGFESAHLKNLLTHEAETWQIAANVLQPIYNSGRISAQVDLSEAELYGSYSNYVQTTLNAFREVDDALSSLVISQELLKLQDEQVVQFNEYLRLATLQYDNGESDYLNVLDAQRRLFEAELAQQAAQADVYTSMIELYRSLGGGFCSL